MERLGMFEKRHGCGCTCDNKKEIFEFVIVKLLENLIRLMEVVMKNKADVEAAIVALTASIAALATAIAAAPKPEDLTAQEAEIQALKAQVDTLTAGLTPAP